MELSVDLEEWALGYVLVNLLCWRKLDDNKDYIQDLLRSQLLGLPLEKHVLFVYDEVQEGHESRIIQNPGYIKGALNHRNHCKRVTL